MISAFFSGSETSLFSYGKIGLAEMKSKNHSLAEKLDYVLSRPSRLLFSILLGNELVNIAFANIIASLVSDYYGLTHWKEATLVSVGISTPLLFIFGEISAKAIAIKAPRQIAIVAITPLFILNKFVSPLFTAWDKLIKPLEKRIPEMQAQNDQDQSISEQHLLGMIDASSTGNIIEKDEREIIHNIFKFSEKTVESIMIPKDQIFFIRENYLFEDIIAGVRTTGFSRIPVLDADEDVVLGLLLTKDLLPYIKDSISKRNKPFSVKELMTPVISISRKSRLYSVFLMLKKFRQHMAIVVNEHGNVIGLLTMEDLLEELFGEIYDERDMEHSES
jgi:putative hemolysin